MSPSKTLGYSPKGSLHSVIHFCILLVPHGWGKLSIFLCSASKIIKGRTNPHPVTLHTHSLHFPHLPWSSSPSLHALQKKKSSFGRFVLTANHQLLLSWEICLVPSYWQQLSTGDRHGVVPQGAAAFKQVDIIPCPASLRMILVLAWIKVAWL